MSHSDKPLLAGVMGFPIKHSLSPILHNYWFKEERLQGSYVPLLVEPIKLESALRSLVKSGFSGCNLTIPLKELAIKIVDDCCEHSKKIGAINCVSVKPNGFLYGSNYDWLGFVNGIKHAFPDFELKNKLVTVLGAGGSSRAVCYGLLSEGVSEILLVNRTTSKAESLKLDLGKAVKVVKWEDRNSCLSDTSLFVNTTNQGMVGEPPLDISLDILPTKALVYDIIYNPLESTLLKLARKRGNMTLNGLNMLIHQAIPAWEQWFNIIPTSSEKLITLMEEGINRG